MTNSEAFQKIAGFQGGPLPVIGRVKSYLQKKRGEIIPVTDLFSAIYKGYTP